MSAPWNCTPFAGRIRGLWRRAQEAAADPMFDREALNIDYYGNVRRKRGGTHFLHATPCSGRIHGLHQAIFRSGVEETIAAAGADLQRVAEPPVTLPLQLPTGTPARVGDPGSLFVMASDLVFAVNGVDRNVKYDGTTVYAMGIETPTLAPVLGPLVAGTLTGTFGYRYTYVRAETQHESEPPSLMGVSLEAVVTYTAQTATLTAAASPDPQVNRTRRYRSTTGGAGVAWFFVDEIVGNGGTFAIDTTPDEGLGILLDEFVSDPAPTLRLLAPWPQAQRLLGVMAESPSALVYSDLLPGFPRPEAWPPENLILVNPEDGDEIVAVHALFDSVIIQKRRSTWRLRGLPPNLVLEPVHFHENRTGIGGLSQKAVVEVDNDLFIPAQDGGYTLSRWLDSGFEATRASRAIDDLWQPLGTGQVNRAHAVFHRARRQVRIWLATPPLTDPDICLVLQLDATADGEPNGWSEWDGLAGRATASGVFQTLNGDRVYMGTVDGFVLEMDQLTEDGWTTGGDGAAYEFRWAPVWFAPGMEAGMDARARRAEFTIKPLAKSTLLISPESDFGKQAADISLTVIPEDVFILDTDPPSIPNAGVLDWVTLNADATPLGDGTIMGEVRNQIHPATYLSLGREHSWRVTNHEQTADFVIEQAKLYWQALPPRRRPASVVQVLP